MHSPGHSYISSDDLASLDLGPLVQSPPHSPLSASNNGYPSSSSFSSTASPGTTVSSFSPKRVAFCPLALLIECAAEGEKEEAMGQTTGAKGRPRLAVRTYSVETANLSSATSKAWRSVCAGFASSLQPILSPNADNRSSSTISISSQRRAPSPDHHTSSPSPSSRPRSASLPTSSPSYKLADDPFFMPDHPRLTIKLPSITRKCPGPHHSSPSCKSILKASSPSPPPTLEGSISISPQRTSESFPTLIPTSSVPLPTCSLHPTKGSVVPLSSCCPSCSKATEYGLSPEWEEQLSKSARRKRRQDEKEELERQEMRMGPIQRKQVQDARRKKMETAVVDELACRGAVEENEESGSDEDGGEKKEEEPVREEEELGLGLELGFAADVDSPTPDALPVILELMDSPPTPKAPTTGLITPPPTDKLVTRPLPALSPTLTPSGSPDLGSRQKIETTTPVRLVASVVEVPLSPTLTTEAPPKRAKKFSNPSALLQGIVQSGFAASVSGGRGWGV